MEQRRPRHAAAGSLLAIGYLPLMGREGDKQALLDWARNGPSVQARILVGHPGSGKTRLAAEVADTLQQEGWSAGFARWSAGQIWRAGNVGTLLIVDDPFDAEGHCWRAIEEAIKGTVIGATALRLLVLSRETWRVFSEQEEGCSAQELSHVSMEHATAIHDAARARYRPERPAPFPNQPFEEWAALEPSVRFRPLYAIASAVSLGHPPWDEGYPSDDRRVIVGPAQATHNLLDDEGERVGLSAGVAPLVAAIAEVRGGLDEAVLRSLAMRTALTRSDADEFVARVKRLPAWNNDRLEASGDSLPQAEFVRMEFGEALERGLDVRIGAAMHTAGPSQVAQLDRNLSNADVSFEVCDRVARAMPLADDRWLAHLEIDPKAGSLLGRLALHAAERDAPSLAVRRETPDEAHDAADTAAGPFDSANPDVPRLLATSGDSARRLVNLARQRRRESGAASAVDAAEEAVRLYRQLLEFDADRENLFNALYFLADCLQDSKSDRTGSVWQEWVAEARRSPDESDLMVALQKLGDCELASDEVRYEALRELAEIHREAGRVMHHAVTQEYAALVAPLDEAPRLVHNADYIRKTLGSAKSFFPNTDVLEKLFQRLKDADRSAALVVAHMQVTDRRIDVADRQFKGTVPTLVARLRLGESLENVAAVSDTDEAREALQEALALFQRVWDRTNRQFAEGRVRRVEEKLREMTDGGE